jgi:hypothetical protein
MLPDIIAWLGKNPAGLSAVNTILSSLPILFQNDPIIKEKLLLLNNHQVKFCLCRNFQINHHQLLCILMQEVCQ